MKGNDYRQSDRVNDRSGKTPLRNLNIALRGFYLPSCVQVDAIPPPLLLAILINHSLEGRFRHHQRDRGTSCGNC